MSLEHWRYFLAIESEFERTTRYVEVAESNFATYSMAFAWLLLSLGSEVDLVCKLLCKQVSPDATPESIGQYRDILGASLQSSRVTVPRFNLSLAPWETWKDDRNPGWWDAYNDVKHHRHESFAEASLANVLGALSGLFVLILTLYARELNEGVLDGELPHLLSHPSMPDVRGMVKRPGTNYLVVGGPYGPSA